MRFIFIIVCYFFCSCVPLLALSHSGTEGEDFTVSGYVKDAGDGEMIVGATISVKGTGRGTVTNAYGFFSLSLPKGTHALEVGFLGYQTAEVIVSENRRISVSLERRVHDVEEVVVMGQMTDNSSQYPLLGVEKMESSFLSRLPVLMGETDPMKAVQLLPGVSATSEGSSNFSVRGGNPDQNLLLMDEAIVYNAGHLLGFFSVFNNDAIKSIELYKGDFPASEGGRLSSVLDVRTRDGNMKKLSGKAGIGLISSRFTLEGPLAKNKMSFLLSGRRTYLDMFLPLAPEKEVRDNRLFFYDTNLKLNWTAGENSRFFFSGYMGRDVFKDDRARLYFGNQTFTLRWNHVFSSSLFANFSLVRSRYDYFLGTSEDDIEDMEWLSEFADYMIGADFSWYNTPEHTTRFGGRSFYHGIEPGIVSGADENSFFKEVELPQSNSLEHALYVSHTAQLASRLVLRLGLRYSHFQNVGKGKSFVFDDAYRVMDTLQYKPGEIFNSYGGLEPRAGVSVFVDPRLLLKASYSRTRQYIQLASNSTSSTPLDVWFAASPNIKPQIADQVSLGIFRTSRNGVFEHSVEFFNKWMQNTIDFKDHPDLMLNEILEAEVRQGTSYARGIELMSRLNTSRVEGWIGYTFSRSERVAGGINQGRPYYSPYDHPHDLSLYLNYQLSQRISLSASWIYYTGTPVSLPVARYEIGGDIVALYSERNGERMPDYHRLDLSMVLWGKKGKDMGGEWSFSVYNAYGRKNAWAINFVNDEEKPFGIRAEKTYLFSVVPSVSYTFRF